MNAELAVDPIDEREQALLDLKRLASSDIQEESFLKSFVDRALSAAGTCAIWIWLINEDGRLKQVACENGESLGLAIDDRARAQLRDQVLRSNQYGSCNARVNDGLELSGFRQIVAAPLQFTDRVAGLIEAAFEEPQSPDQLEATAFFLEAAGHCFTRYLGWREELNDPARQLAFWITLEEVLGRIHESLDPTEVAARTANDGRMLIGCDRVTIVLGFPRRPFVAAMSGVSNVNQRSAATHSATCLATTVAATAQPITFSGRSSDLPSPVEEALSAYALATGIRFVRVIPLLRVRERSDLSERLEATSGPIVIGVMLVEHLGDSSPSPLQLSRADVFAAHAARALTNAETHHRIFLRRARRRLGVILSSIRDSRPLLSIVLALVAATTASVLCLVSAPYKIEVKGQLMPVEQQHVYAPLDGQVVRIFVHSGDRVHVGDRLLELQNDRLSTELLVARNELQEKRQIHEVLRAQLESFDHKTGNADEIRLRGQLLRLEVEIRGSQKQIQLIEQQAASLVVCSPIEGTVVTFEVEDALMSRPVDRGTLLLDVMNVDGDWQLELEIPEKHSGALLMARADADRGELPVQFIVATAPEMSHQAVLRRLGTTADASERFGLAVQAVAAIAHTSLADPRVGAEVDAKIECGERRLITVLFGDFINFVRRKVW